MLNRLMLDQLADLTDGKETLLEVASRQLEENDAKQITLAIQKRELYPEEPVEKAKASSPKRHHIFHDAEGFAAYLAKYKTDDTVVMVDVAARRAVAVINEKADKGFEHIILSPVIHPKFQPWLNIFGDMNKIRNFVDFLGENRRTVIEPDGKELALLLSQVKVSTKTTLHRGSGRQSINGIVCEMEICGQKQSEELQIPETIIIETPIFVSCDPVKLEVDINIDSNGELVVVTCLCPDLTQAFIDTFDEMLKVVRDIPEVLVTLGKPDYENWKRVGDRI